MLSVTDLDIRHIAVFRALVIGDMLCAVPAFRAIRNAFPAVNITLIGLPWAADFVKRFGVYFNDFIEFPGYPGLPEQPFNARTFPPFIKQVRNAHFDLALQFQGSGSYVNELLELFDARHLAGFHPADEAAPRGMFFPYPDDIHEIHRNLKLVESLGLASRGEHLEWPLLEEDFRALGALPEASELAAAPYVCIHPGARYLSRRWHVERFAEVAEMLHAVGFQVVLTGGAAEADLVASVAAQLPFRAFNLCGRTSLGALGALVSQAQVVITNDTGMSHLAAALRIPSVVVVTGSDPCRWAPLDSQLHRVAMHTIHCRPCADPVCPFGMECADRVSAAEVVRLARQQLELSSIRCAI